MREEFQEPKDFDDIAMQFELSERHLRDAKTGLLYHGWDESKKEKWADPATGRSGEFWARGMGWYAMALVDTLELLSRGASAAGGAGGILNRLAKALVAQQDAKTGLWQEVVDKPGRRGTTWSRRRGDVCVRAVQGRADGIPAGGVRGGGGAGVGRASRRSF